MSNLYEKAFIRILSEEPEINDAETENVTDGEAFEKQLDADTDPSDFDTDADSANVAIAATNKIELNMIRKLNEWITSLETFGKFLNGVDDASMQTILSKSIPDTIFDKIRVTEAKKISRVAMEIVSLNEMLKGYLATANDSKYKFV